MKLREKFKGTRMLILVILAHKIVDFKYLENFQNHFESSGKRYKGYF